MTTVDGERYIREQLEIALGPVNKYYFWLATGVRGDDADPEALVWFYFTHGGADEYRQTHQIA